MLATIVVMVYRNMDGLVETLRSIAKQDYQDIEVIVSDDASEGISTENLRECLRQAVGEEQQTKYLVRQNEKNMGIVAHFNTIVKLSKGEILIPLSCQDQFFDEKIVSHIVEFFIQQNCLLATAKRACYDADTGAQTEVLPTAKQIKTIKEGGQNLIDLLCLGNFISGACTCYSRKLFDKYGPFDETMFLVEDYPMYLRLLFAGDRICFIDEITIRYQMSGISSGTKKNPLFVKDMETIYRTVMCTNRNQIGKRTMRHLELREKLHGSIHPFRYFYLFLYLDVIAGKLISIIRK